MAHILSSDEEDILKLEEEAAEYGKSNFINILLSDVHSTLVVQVVSIGIFWFYFVSFSYNGVYFFQLVLFEALETTF